MSQHHTSFETAIGYMAIVWTNKGVCGLQLPEETEAKTLTILKKRFPQAAKAEPTAIVQKAIKLIKLHLEGKPQDFRGIPLDLSLVSPFSRQVYEASREVASGQVVTYGEIAERIGQPAASRAVGRRWAVIRSQLLCPATA